MQVLTGLTRSLLSRKSTDKQNSTCHCTPTKSCKAVAALDEQAEGDDNELDDQIEDDEVSDQDDLDDDELLQMLQDNESSAGAMTDTANTDWYAACAVTSKPYNACPPPVAVMPGSQQTHKLTYTRLLKNLRKTCKVMQLHADLHDSALPCVSSTRSQASHIGQAVCCM